MSWWNIMFRYCSVMCEDWRDALKIKTSINKLYDIYIHLYFNKNDKNKS